MAVLSGLRKDNKMGISVEEAVKEIQGRENIYVAYSQVTKLPYVKRHLMTRYGFLQRKRA